MRDGVHSAVDVVIVDVLPLDDREWSPMNRQLRGPARPIPLGRVICVHDEAQSRQRDKWMIAGADGPGPVLPLAEQPMPVPPPAASTAAGGAAVPTSS
ncbi:hypothetical protein GCM10022222_32620 [Amycolatopsis ultiminotia]|uniref:Uncharacterized protein n=1 Tax=Amycolatopsis ultiminotia TaxID=543629 RepID=A0ABP6W7V7_9PSEU